MSFVPEEFTSESFDSEMQLFIQWLTGAINIRPESIIQRVPLAELEEKAKTALKAAQEDNSNAVLRSRAVYAQALFRDAKYAAASRGELMGIGADGRVIELYEGSYIAKNMGA